MKSYGGFARLFGLSQRLRMRSQDLQWKVKVVEWNVKTLSVVRIQDKVSYDCHSHCTGI